MMLRRALWLVGAVLALTLLAGCGGAPDDGLTPAAVQGTATPTRTATPTPTAPAQLSRGELLAQEPRPIVRPLPTIRPRPTRTPIPSPTTSPERITAYTFADSDHGWLAIDSTLWHTADGGATWQSQLDLPAPAQQIVFASTQEGWLATADSYLATSDGGATWQPIADRGPLHLPRWYYKHCPEWFHAMSVSFLNAQQGWLLCGSEPGGGQQAKQLLATDDGGQTWTARADTWAYSEGFVVGGELSRFGAGGNIFFLDAQQGWLTSGQGRISHTSDGGATWSSWGNVVIEVLRWKGQPFFLSAHEGFVLFGSGDRHNSLVRTRDGGATWEPLYP